MSYVPDYIVEVNVGDCGCMYILNWPRYYTIFHKDTFHACVYTIHKSIMSYRSSSKRDLVPATLVLYSNIRIRG